MKVAVIGTGHIGGTLGSKWRAAGHEVTYGSRRGGDGQEGPGGAPLRAIGEAMDGADVVVIAVPGGAVGEVLAEHGAALAGRVVVDATNQMGGGRADRQDTITAGVPANRSETHISCRFRSYQPFWRRPVFERIADA